MRRTISTLAFAFLAAPALAGNAGNLNSVRVNERIFDDRPDSALVVDNSYPAYVQMTETGFGPGGWQNRHTAYLSADGGASNFDFNYEDAFDISVTVSHLAETSVGVEAGIQSDLFGLGFFGQLPNGEVVSFGSILPFHSFGFHPYGASIDLRMIHTPGTGDGINPLPLGGTPSSIEYQYNLGGGWVSSGQIPFGGTEGGIFSPAPFYIGFGATHNNVAEVGAVADTLFNNFSVTIPTPGAAGVLGLAGLVVLRRRR